MWEILPPAIQTVIIIGVLIGAVVGGAFWFRNKLNDIAQDADEETTRKVTELEQRLRERTETEIGALKRSIDTLEAWNERQQEKIHALEDENNKLELSLTEAKDERRRLEERITTLRVDKSLLEGQLAAYKEMLSTVLCKEERGE